MSDDDQCGLDDVGTPHTTPPARSACLKKERVHMDELAVLRAKNIRPVIEFDENDQPTGKYVEKLQSYLGVLVRRHCRISYEDWDSVPQEAKAIIWDSVETTFVIDGNWKRNCFSSVAKKFRDWKSRLYRDHVRPHLGTNRVMIPPPIPGIDLSDWHAFVISRTTDDARKKSAEGVERRSQNKYDHTMSCKGYKGLKKELADKLTGDDEVDRAILWKQDRANKKGEYANEDLTQRAHRIEQLIKAKEDGVLTRDNPNDDILTQALEKPETRGRVRSVGGYLVPPSQYFRGTKGQSDPETQKLREELRMTNEKLAVSQEQIALMQASLARIEAQMHRGRDEQRASCSGVRTSPDMYRPNEVTSTLVKLPKARKSPSPDVVKIPKAQLPRELRQLRALVVWARMGLPAGNGLRIEVDENVFGHSTHTFLMSEDVTGVREMRVVGASFIVPYCWHLYKELEGHNLLGLVRLAAAGPIAHEYDEKSRVQYVSNLFIQMSEDQLLLLPCNVGYHWILLVAKPYDWIVYILDPLPHEIHYERWPSIINIQPSDSNVCAYYVARFMKEIKDMLRDTPHQLKDMFCEAPYTRLDLDEIREEWATVVHEYIISNAKDDL